MMARKRDATAPDAEQFGFRWGQLDVSRYFSLGTGQKCLAVLTDHTSIEVYVSPTGRSIRVFKDGKEMK